MTAREIFEYFCGLNKIKPYVRDSFIKSKVINWSKYDKNPLNRVKSCKVCDDVNNLMTYSEYFDLQFSSHGFNDLLYYMTSYTYYGMLSKYPRFKRAARKWKYFTKHNIIPAYFDINVGDVIEVKNRSLINLRGRTFTVIGLDSDGRVAKVLPEGVNKKPNTDFYYVVKYDDIVKVNEKRISQSYSIKIRGKVLER